MRKCGERLYGLMGEAIIGPLDIPLDRFESETLSSAPAIYPPTFAVVDLDFITVRNP